MPFVMMCGLPSSGKTTRAKLLERFLRETCSKHVVIVGDEEQKIDKNEVYASSHNEKTLRGNLKSAMQRVVSKEDVVILDSLNYIKGFRYELYCATKGAHTPHCVIYCDIGVDQASQWNANRPDSEKYTQETFDGLVMRFEAPEDRHRWDSPLFTVLPEDELPCQQIYDALYERKAPPPNKATLSQPLSATNFVQELDQVTQAILADVNSAMKTSMPGDSFKVTRATEKITLTRNVTFAELQRHKRQFISYTKSRPVDNKDRLANMFVQYLNEAMSS